MEQLQIKNLYNLQETIAAPLFDGVVYPWELLSKKKNLFMEILLLT